LQNKARQTKKVALKKRQVKLSVLVAALAVLAGCRQKGKEWVCQEAAVSFRLPNPHEWAEVRIPQAYVNLGLHQIKGKSGIMFLAIKGDAFGLSRRDLSHPDAASYEKFATEFESTLKTNRFEKISGEFVTFKGRQAYKLVGKKVFKKINDDRIRVAVLVWFEKNYMLEIIAMTPDIDPLQNATVKEFMDSMKILPASISDVAISTNHP
jgi:hypothetical protein